ncbi:DNA (cytosine-5-)-methyltransferase [Armatimonas sp.]|uniref:DNA cytosine methyltransferase n=1 Tax=Armatimonas sp. TaxID=1872638 RepID=UPI00286C9ADB|nr:DNA (cytosine-5-)-methyltransferase [Armatimonas sp.]
MRFIDLFAGLGGFHVGLTALGHQCVFACELDEQLRLLYKQNFDIEPKGDIRQVLDEEVPEHDILCAGFPCQPFSKAGEQQGFDHPESGDLFTEHILRIIHFRKPLYIILENVPNLEKHNNGKTFENILSALRLEGYDPHFRHFSPHQFGVPQRRERLFIIASRSPLEDFNWPIPIKNQQPSIKTILEPNSQPPLRPLSDQVTRCLDVWQEFLQAFPSDKAFPSFPIWSMEFGADYPYLEQSPSQAGLENLRGKLGCHGTPLVIDDEILLDQVLKQLPSYAKQDKFPDWKIDFIKKNRKLYSDHKELIDAWMPKILQFPPSLQKFEWNCKGETRDIWKYVIQFRASGVRVKRPTTAPSLVAMTSTQVPIIAWEKRYMTPKECASLQSLQSLKNLPISSNQAFKALGNAVNAHVVELIAAALIGPKVTEKTKCDCDQNDKCACGSSQTIDVQVEQCQKKMS